MKNQTAILKTQCTESDKVGPWMTLRVLTVKLMMLTLGSKVDGSKTTKTKPMCWYCYDRELYYNKLWLPGGLKLWMTCYLDSKYLLNHS